MSKMDRILNSKNDKESIYEIYRACRLCGGGAGYKMPIIQNIIDLDEADVELKLKIRECVQIEVHQDDKMPPLICELCVDKVNDFYEFLEMCRQTNKKTRFRLGLPPQSLPRGAPDAGDCILGLTEPVFVNEDSDGEPLSRHKKLPKVVVKKEPVVRIKVENLQEERSSRQKKHKREKTPPRVTRQGVKSKEDDIALSNIKEKSSKPGPQSPKTAPKSILKKENSVKSNSSDDTSQNRLKRTRDKEVVKLETPTKKVKVTIKPPPPPPPPKQSPKTPPKPKPSPKPEQKPVKQKQAPSPVVTSPKKSPLPSSKDKISCTVCGQHFKTTQAMKSHLKTHSAQFTNTKLACNPCGDWFNTPDEVSLHHRRHKYKNIPYYCTKCDTDFKTLDDYDTHVKDNDCMPLDEVPDIKCESCWHLFPTNNLYEKHKCLGADNRPGGNCFKCKKSFVFLKTLKKHQAACTGKKKDKFNISRKLLGKLKPMQVRIVRCDSLLPDDKETRCDVSCVSMYYGLDPNCYYPYISGLRIKSEFSGMVDIRDEIKDEFFAENYVHWDSDQSDSEDEITCNVALNPSSKRRQVDTLTALALKTIFSPRLIGKVPRKKRKVKAEKFDSLMADEDEVRMDISSIINNLGDDNDDESNGIINKINDSKNDSVSNNDSDKIVSFNDDSSKNNNDEFNDTTSVDSVDLLKDIRNNFNDSTDSNNVNNDSQESESLRNESNDSAKEMAVNDSDTIANESQESESLQNESNDGVNDNKVNDSDTNNASTNSRTDSMNKNESDSKLESVSNNINSKLNDSIKSNITNNDSKNDSDTKDIDVNDSTDSKISKDFDCTVNDKIVNKDKLPLDELLSSNAGSNVGLGINDFSFDY